MHPRTRQHLVELGLEAGLPEARVLLSPPLGYLAFLGLQAEARFLLTDSGGVQEETSALGVRCFTLRNSTERPVTVELGTNTVLGARPDRIAEIPSLAGAGAAGAGDPALGRSRRRAGGTSARRRAPVLTGSTGSTGR